jgi:uncharacterized protein DUF5565
MHKIPTVFQRNHDTDRRVRDEVTPGCEWVLAGEGIATEKFDGTCCCAWEGKLFKRYELKRGKQEPHGFVAAQTPDPVTGDIPGWVPVGEGPEDQWHREALALYLTCAASHQIPDGTYELVGPKVQGNPLGYQGHHLLQHGIRLVFNPVRTFDGIREALITHPYIEGIVWHHPDGRRAKIKQRDFGFAWPYKPGKDS